MKKYLAEFIGTFTLVLFGCGTAVVAGKSVGVLGIAIALGFALIAMAYGIGPISGCHINPAVSVGVFVAGRMRRSEVAKNFLIEQGIAADKIETQAYGEERNLNSEEVKQLLARNPDGSEQAREKALQKEATVVYAHNRRVDMKLSTTGQESAQSYPFAAEDFSTLVKRGKEAMEGLY